MLSFEQIYDLSSSDNNDVIKIDILENEIISKKHSDLETLSKDVKEIIEEFNLNSLGMKMFQDETNVILLFNCKWKVENSIFFVEFLDL